MQTLGERQNQHTLECSSSSKLCGLMVKVSCEVGTSAVGRKNVSQLSDEALTARRAGQDLRVPVVYVINMWGIPIMPTTPRKARVLLKVGKAEVIRRTPFTIRLNYPTGGNKQPITLGVDAGYLNIGLSAITEAKEVYAAVVKLRKDIVGLLSTRRMYRRTRRSRKTRYRKPRFSNRSKPKNWLAPSIKHKLDSHLKVVEQVKSFLPVSAVIVEVAAFDSQKIQNLEIKGVEYQQGVQKDFWNVREYILYRDGHKCQICKGKSGDKILQVHHIESRKTGSDRPDNLVTLCRNCHWELHAGKTKLPKRKRSNNLRAAAFMTAVRWRLVDELNCEHTYGYITKSRRIELRLPKSHVDDAFVIAKGRNQTRVTQYLTKQVRKQNRKLYKGARSHLRNTAPRFVGGFQRFDKVLWRGVECFVFGRRCSGYFNLRTLTGNRLSASAKMLNLRLLESAKTLLVERSGVSSSA